jgi:tRNA(adenine34) deaminase
MNFMSLAYKEAQKAQKRGEVPIGCVIVRNGKVISAGCNRRERKQNALWHAEIVAINKACKKLRSWRLNDCEMYVTLEPCKMCMGAIENARLQKVYIGAKSSSDLNWNVVTEFCENDDCRNILIDFFKDKR